MGQVVIFEQKLLGKFLGGVVLPNNINVDTFDGFAAGTHRLSTFGGTLPTTSGSAAAFLNFNCDKPGLSFYKIQYLLVYDEKRIYQRVVYQGGATPWLVFLLYQS